MSRRYTYSTCVSFGTDGDAGYVEHDVTVSFTVAWGSPETGRGYMADPYSYDPGAPDVVEDIRVELIDGAAPAVEPVYLAMIIDEVERAAEADMLAVAQEYEASDHAAALDYRAEQMREDRGLS